LSVPAQDAALQLTETLSLPGLMVRSAAKLRVSNTQVGYSRLVHL